MERHWWQSEIVYQIYPKSFKDANGDGIGDLRGIIECLDDLAELGITSIWICPIYQSPMVDNGYDISDYYQIDGMFGTVDDVRELVGLAKAKGIKIIMDLVVNHTSDQHPWFQEALRHKDSPYRDYYIFREGKAPPNNWRSIFGGSVWEKLPNENTYYYHTFHTKQPDLNWENPVLREEIYQMVNWWLALGIAGFRVDAITFIKKDLSFRSLDSDGVDGLAKCTRLSRNQPGIEVFLRELRERCFAETDCVTIAEAPGVPYHQLDDFIGSDGYFSMIFDFKHADLDVASGSEWFKPVDWQLETLYQLLEQSQLAIQKVGWAAPFIENHDQPRATTKYLQEHATNREAVKALGLLYFFLRGTSFIYQGQELGLTNVQRHSITDFDDISSIDQYHRGIAEGLSPEAALGVINQRSRDHARLPYPWDKTDHQGFSQAQPWLKSAPYPLEQTLSEQKKDPASVWQFYKAMIALSKGVYHDVLHFGAIHFPKRQQSTTFLYRRTLGSITLLFAINLSDKEAVVPVAHTVSRTVFSNGMPVQVTDNQLHLAPFGAVILEED